MGEINDLLTSFEFREKLLKLGDLKDLHLNLEF